MAKLSLLTVAAAAAATLCTSVQAQSLRTSIAMDANSMRALKTQSNYGNAASGMRAQKTTRVRRKASRERRPRGDDSQEHRENRGGPRERGSDDESGAYGAYGAYAGDEMLSGGASEEPASAPVDAGYAEGPMATGDFEVEGPASAPDMADVDSVVDDEYDEYMNALAGMNYGEEAPAEGPLGGYGSGSTLAPQLAPASADCADFAPTPTVPTSDFVEEYEYDAPAPYPEYTAGYEYELPVDSPMMEEYEYDTAMGPVSEGPVSDYGGGDYDTSAPYSEYEVAEGPSSEGYEYEVPADAQINEVYEYEVPAVVPGGAYGRVQEPESDSHAEAPMSDYGGGEYDASAPYSEYEVAEGPSSEGYEYEIPDDAQINKVYDYQVPAAMPNGAYGGVQERESYTYAEGPLSEYYSGGYEYDVPAEGPTGGMPEDFEMLYEYDTSAPYSEGPISEEYAVAPFSDDEYSIAGMPDTGTSPHFPEEELAQSEYDYMVPVEEDIGASDRGMPESRFHVCLNEPHPVFFGLPAPLYFNKPDGLTITPEGRCEFDEFVGGFDGVPSLHFKSGHSLGMDATVEQMFPYNPTEQSAFIEDLLALAQLHNLEYPEDMDIAEDGVRFENIMRLNEACSQLITVSQCL